MISLTFAKIHLDQVYAAGNFAVMNANGISLVQAEAAIHNSVFTNVRNGVSMSEKQLIDVEAGFINMNYQSRIHFTNTTITGFKAQTAAFIFSTGQSSINISDQVNVTNMTSSAYSIMAY